MAEPGQRFPEGLVPRQRAQLARRRHQRRRLARDQPVVFRLREAQRVRRHELAHLAHAHLVRRPREHADPLHPAQQRQLGHRPAVQVIAHDDRRLVIPQRVHRGHPTPQHRVVHCVVVHQRRQVHQLDRRSERDRFRPRPPPDLARKQE